MERKITIAAEALREPVRASAAHLVRELVGSETTEALLGHLAAALAGFGVSRFSVFAVQGEDAQLAFSRGITAQAEVSTGESFSLAPLPELRAFLTDSGASSWVPPLAMASPNEQTAGVQAVLVDGSIVFRLAAPNGLFGFLIVYGLIPEPLFARPQLDEVELSLGIFSSMFIRLRQGDRLRRDQARANARIDAFQQSQDILLLATADQVIHAALTRILRALGTKIGSVWLLADGRFQAGQLIGMPTTEQMEDSNRLLEVCLKRGLPVAVNAVSGEEVLEFDADTIHLVSALAMPLATQDQQVGCVVAFDATLSGETLDVLRSITLVTAIAIENARQRSRMLDEQRMREQLALGAKMQLRLLPAKRLVSPDFSVAYYSRYCDETGGDYVDTVAHKNPRVVSFVIGDVSGHGLGAALVMVDLRARLRTLMQSSGGHALDQAMVYLNTCLCQETSDEEFATLVLATLDLNTGLLNYVSAGHEAPLLLHVDHGTWEELPSTGLPLGMIEEADYSVQRAWVGSGDVLLFLTDGVTEAVDREGRVFGHDSIQRVVEAAASCDAQAVLDAVLQHTLNRCDERRFVDDVTYLLIKAEHVTLKQREALPADVGESVHSAKFPSTRDEKDRQLGIVIDRLTARLPKQDLSAVYMAIEEALTNAVVHGNREDPSLPTQLQISLDADRLTVDVRDRGNGFSPQSAVERAHDPERLLMESGRGLTMMVTMMDEVIYCEGGRTVRLIKNLGPAMR